MKEINDKMNILYITTVFPRPDDGATIYTDLACSLSKRGHSLTVVVADGKDRLVKSRFFQERGLEVLRIRTGNLYNVGLIKKGIANLLLGWRMKTGIARFLKNRQFGLILYETPPLSVCRAVAYAKKRFHAHTFLMLKDIFPQNGADLGLYKKSSIVYRYFRQQEKALYRVSDKIGCMSKANMEYIKQHNQNVSHKVVYFPNTKASAKLSGISRNAIRKKFGLPKGRIIFVFGGNIGLPQSPDFVVACAKIICGMDHAFFLAVGRGTHTDYVRKSLADFKNFKVLDNMKRSDYDELLSACDVGLIFLDCRFSVPNFPSRILSYMNLSLAVLAATDTATDIKDLIESSGCGLWCPSENTVQFEACANDLCENTAKRLEMGAKGYHYFINHFDADTGAQLLETYTEKF